MKKYKAKAQKGSVSMFVMIAMAFFLTTIIGIYMISSKRTQMQTESLNMLQSKYYTEGKENEKYSLRIPEENAIIPIYTKEQLWSVGKNKIIEIEGKLYDFSETNLYKYELKNDIVINMDELGANEVSEPIGIQKNNFEIYYYKDKNYYVLSTDDTADLTINGNKFKIK